uniref:Uncharacterized protein n=1 Tax=Schistocephalus solidus TaxID=70667 RepID=A0A0X3PM54_SCHSO
MHTIEAFKLLSGQLLCGILKFGVSVYLYRRKDQQSMQTWHWLHLQTRVRGCCYCKCGCIHIAVYNIGRWKLFFFRENFLPRQPRQCKNGGSHSSRFYWHQAHPPK